ncbi:hypothetical protein O6H91_18G084400 [Diphasiastrum complanatum]|uniref:Uncharacterized protein n=1 Tax=Diphasiastrum complanatum TaxID=34168 RepID=A0ACC2B3G1_DIPCM|nr:hypothetical protein O6H91_18G084400 [Diphasiastrum complanatum]
MRREQMPQDGNGLMLYVDISPSAVDRNCGFEKKRVEFADWDALRRYSEQKVGERSEDREQEMGDEDGVGNGRTKPLRSLNLNTLNREATQNFHAKLLSSSKVGAVVRGCSKALKRPALSQEDVGGEFKENEGVKSQLISQRKVTRRKTFATLEQGVQGIPLMERPFSCSVSQENCELEIHGRSHVSAKPGEFEGKVFLDLDVEGFAPLARAEQSCMDVSAVDHLSEAHRILRTITAQDLHNPLHSQENVTKDAMDEMNALAERSNLGSSQQSEAQLHHLALSFWPSYPGVTETESQHFSSQLCSGPASAALEKFVSSRTSSNGVNAQAFKRSLKRGKKTLNPQEDSRVYMHDNSGIGTCSWAFNFTEPISFIGGFKPGIMTKVRDSKQVSAFLGSILRSATGSNLCNKSESVEAEMNKRADAMDDDLDDDDNDDCHSTEALLETQTSCCSENIDVLEQVDESIRTLAQAKIDAKATSNWDSKNDESTYNVNLGLEDIDHEMEKLGALRKVGDGSKCILNDKKIQEGLRGQCSDVTTLIDLNKDISRTVYADHSKENNDIEECFVEGQQQVACPNTSCSGSAAAADVASQWLDLLGLDIKGRLSALKRSRRRVRNIIVSGQLDSASGDLFQSHAPQVTGACLTHSTSIHSNFKGESLTEQGNFIAEVEHELQMDRWRSLFISMEAVLNMEGEKLVLA